MALAQILGGPHDGEILNLPDGSEYLWVKSRRERVFLVKRAPASYHLRREARLPAQKATSFNPGPLNLFVHPNLLKVGLVK